MKKILCPLGITFLLSTTGCVIREHEHEYDRGGYYGYPEYDHGEFHHHPYPEYREYPYRDQDWDDRY